MTEPTIRPLSDKRLAEIAALPKTINHHAWSAAADASNAIRDLTREVERCHKLLAHLGEPELQHRLINDSGDAYTPTERDLAMSDDWLPGVRHEVRDVHPTPWRSANADAAQPSTPNGAP